MTIVPHRDVAEATGLSQLCRCLGATVGPIMFQLCMNAQLASDGAAGAREFNLAAMRALATADPVAYIAATDRFVQALANTYLYMLALPAVSVPLMFCLSRTELRNGDEDAGDVRVVDGAASSSSSAAACV